MDVSSIQRLAAKLADGDIEINRIGCPLDEVLSADTGVVLSGEGLTADVYARHPCRILALSAEATHEDILAEADRILARDCYQSDIGGIPIGYESLVKSQRIVEAVESIKSMSLPLFWKLFWPHLPHDVFAQIFTEAGLFDSELIGRLNNYRDSLVDAAEKAKASHAIAVTIHSMAIMIECAYAYGHAPAPIALWKRAFKAWHEVCESDEFWMALSRDASTATCPNDYEAFVSSARAEIPMALLGVNWAFIQHYAHAGNIAACQRHLVCLHSAESGKFKMEEALSAIASAVYAMRVTVAG